MLDAAARKKYNGWRIENAEVFAGVSRGIDYAVVMGDYPEVVAALKEANVEVKKTAELKLPVSPIAKRAKSKVAEPAEAEQAEQAEPDEAAVAEIAVADSEAEAVVQ